MTTTGEGSGVNLLHGDRTGIMTSESDPRIVLRVVDVYPYRAEPSGPRFLLLRRAPGRVYEGSWRMVGGKIAAGETAWQAGLRELGEETGLRPRAYWAVPSVNAFYEWERDRVNLAPAFAAEVDGEPVLDGEHDACAWLTADEATARLAWPEQRRLLRMVADLLARGVPAECRILP